ncbi:hypothetical protein tb265_22530 [Gemmatimonadetes bacterium T265]|nr:hypothetical protein tb265_22530 [Gemmatimonadetes bacterium T265]
MPRAAALAVVALAAAGTVAACGRDGRPARAARPAGSPPLLAGVWDATFSLDVPPLGYDSAALRQAAQGRVRGRFAFMPNHYLPASVATGVGLPAAPTLYGTYDVDFRPFGFDPRNGDRVPDVVGVAPGGPSAAGGAAADSVTLLLSPSNDRAQVLLAGTVRGDSVVGTWHLQSAGRGGPTAVGHFVLVAPAAGRAASTPAPRAGLAARAP